MTDNVHPENKKSEHHYKKKNLLSNLLLGNFCYAERDFSKFVKNMFFNVHQIVPIHHNEPCSLHSDKRSELLAIVRQADKCIVACRKRASIVRNVRERHLDDNQNERIQMHQINNYSCNYTVFASTRAWPACIDHCHLYSPCSYYVYYNLCNVVFVVLPF